MKAAQRGRLGNLRIRARLQGIGSLGERSKVPVDFENREKVLDYIEDLIRAFEFEKALDLAKTLVDTDKGEAQVWYFLGLCHFFLGKMSDSEVALLVARERDPDLYQVTYFLAHVYLQTKRHREAYEIAIEQIELHKYSPIAVKHLPFMWMVRAEAECVLFDRSTALASIVKGLHAFPDDLMLKISFDKYAKGDATGIVAH